LFTCLYSVLRELLLSERCDGRRCFACYFYEVLEVSVIRKVPNNNFLAEILSSVEALKREKTLFLGFGLVSFLFVIGISMIYRLQIVLLGLSEVQDKIAASGLDPVALDIEKHLSLFYGFLLLVSPVLFFGSVVFAWFFFFVHFKRMEVLESDAVEVKKCLGATHWRIAYELLREYFLLAIFLGLIGLGLVDFLYLIARVVLPRWIVSVMPKFVFFVFHFDVPCVIVMFVCFVVIFCLSARGILRGY